MNKTKVAIFSKGSFFCSLLLVHFIFFFFFLMAYVSKLVSFLLVSVVGVRDESQPEALAPNLAPTKINK